MTELTTTDLTWFVIMVGYFALIFLTFLPTLRAYMKNVGDVKLMLSGLTSWLAHRHGGPVTL